MHPCIAFKILGNIWHVVISLYFCEIRHVCLFGQLPQPALQLRRIGLLRIAAFSSLMHVHLQLYRALPCSSPEPTLGTSRHCTWVHWLRFRHSSTRYYRELHQARANDAGNQTSGLTFLYQGAVGQIPMLETPSILGSVLLLAFKWHCESKQDNLSTCGLVSSLSLFYGYRH